MKKRTSLAIGLDVGTTAIKVSVFDSTLRSLLSLSAPVGTNREEGRVELDAEKVFSDVRNLLGQVAIELGSDMEKVVGLGLSAQRSTVVFWTDAGTLAPAMTWQDVRAADLLKPLAKHESTLFQKTGLRLTPHYCAPKIQWALQNIESVQKALSSGRLMAAPISTYLIWRLTEGQTYAIDPTQAQRTLLFDLKKRTWDSTLCRWFGVPKRILPEIRTVRSSYGDFFLAGGRVPILSSIGDTQAAAFAAGLGRASPLSIQYGTGAFVARYCGTKPIFCPGLLTSLYVSEKKQAEYFVEGTINSAASLLKWLEQDPIIQRTDLPLQKPILLPALAGLGSPHWLPTARPRLFGPLVDCDLREVGAEAIGYRAREIISLMERFGLKSPDQISVSGGLVQDDGFAQLQADLLQKNLRCSRGDASSAAGAAALVFGGTSVHPAQTRSVRPKVRKSIVSSNTFARVIHLAKMEKRRPLLNSTLWETKMREVRPLFFAHRGAFHVAPENTLEAFDLAVKYGADGIELDVRLTKDHVPVVLHDSSLKRTTGQKGDVEKTLQKNLPESIPTLAEAMKAIPETVLLYVELKSRVSGYKLWKEVFRVAGRDRRVLFCSFDTKLALRFKKEHPDVAVGVNIGRSHPKGDPKEPLYPELDLIGFRDIVVTQALIERCRLQTQMAFVWTVDRAPSVKKFVNWGVDGIITNRIERVRLFSSPSDRSSEG